MADGRGCGGRSAVVVSHASCCETQLQSLLKHYCAHLLPPSPLSTCCACLPAVALHCIVLWELLQPVLDTNTLLQLTPAKYRVTHLPAPPPPHHHISNSKQQQQQQQAELSPQQQQLQQEQQLIEQAVAAAAAFRAVAAEASGLSSPAATNHSSTNTSSAAAAAAPQFGPWRPFMAPLCVNERVTAADHFQDTRHLEFDLSGSGGLQDYQPGDLLAIFPRTPAADVEVRKKGFDF